MSVSQRRDSADGIASDWADPENRQKKNPNHNLQVFINPEIVQESEDDEEFEEGCLSIPGVTADVYRPISVRARYRDLNFEEHEIEADGLLARVLQHEIDHLNGVLFVDHISRAKRLALAGKLYLLKKQTLSRMTAK